MRLYRLISCFPIKRVVIWLCRFAASCVPEPVY